MRFSRRTRALVLMIVLALFAAACGDDGDAAPAEPDGEGGESEATTTTEAPKSGGVITMGMYTETAGLDPVVSTGGGTTGATEMGALYGTLMRFDPDTREYEPAMAKALTPNDDFTVWTLELRPDVKFTDGTPFDAEAVVFGMKRHAQYGSTMSALMSGIEYEITDPLTVTMTIPSSWPGFPYVLASPGGMIPSKTAVEAACTDATKPPRECSFNTAPVGAGPFMLESYRPKDSISLTRNPTYWAGPVPLDGVKFVALRGAAITYESIKSGELQVGFLREAEATTLAREEGATNLYSNMQGLGGIAMLNNGDIVCRSGQPSGVCGGKPDGVIRVDKPTANATVRRAIAAATDPRQLDQRRNAGKGHPGTAFFIEGPLATDETYEYDPAEATKLLEEAKAETGWDGSISVTCLQEQPSGQAFVQTMQAMLESVGFKVTPNLMPSTEYIQKVQLTRDYDIACWGFNVAAEAPEASFARTLVSTAGGNIAGNAMNLQNPEFDALVAQLREAGTDDDKQVVLDEMTELWQQEMPAVIYDTIEEIIASSKTVKGLRYNIATTVVFDQAWLDD